MITLKFMFYLKQPILGCISVWPKKLIRELISTHSGVIWLSPAYTYTYAYIYDICYVYKLL